jgi:hypothetical protein
MIPSFVRPKVDQDACGDHAILYFMRCRAKTVGRDASAALLSKSWKGVGPHVKCRCGRHFCYTCNGDLSENKSTCTAMPAEAIADSGCCGSSGSYYSCSWFYSSNFS